MSKTFFAELDSEILTGVAYKNVNLKKQLVSYFANTGNATISDLSKELGLSAPKVTAMINELIEDGIVKDHGKIESTGGRKPNIFGITPDSGYFLGIDVKHNYINIGLTDFQKNLIKSQENLPYELSNDKASLQRLCQLIRGFIKALTISKDKILSIGINLSGRVNYATGYSYSFFYFQEDPLSKIIEEQLSLRVFLENDSNAMAYGEFNAGVVKDEKDVLFLNIDYGIGLGIMIDSQLYYGKSGYSGEFGHMPLFDNEIICQCGKKGCLETEASGWALINMFKAKLKSGSTSLLTQGIEDIDKITVNDIIAASLKDDVLAIELIGKIGEKLGRGIAALINIFNPELVILGGSLAKANDYLRIPIISAVNKYSLSLMNNDTQLKFSKLGNKAGIIGAGLIARNRLLTFI